MTDLSILVVDNDEKRITQLRRLIADLRIRNLVEEAHDSSALRRLLQRWARTGQSALPLFLLLDAETCGVPQLRLLKAQPFWDRVPIVMLHVSVHEVGVTLVDAGADLYLLESPSAHILTSIYDKARQVREGTLKKRWAFNTETAEISKGRLDKSTREVFSYV